MIDEITNGCLGLWEKQSDYILTEGLLDALPTLFQQDEIIYQYNQGKQDWSTKSCTLFSPIGALSDLWNVEVPLSTIKEWDNGSYSKGRKENEWWLIAKGVDYIVDCWNNSDYWKKYWMSAYYSIDLKNDELVKWVLDKRYTICTWFQWNSQYQNDKNKDGILDWTEWWNYTFGHAVGAIWWITTPSRIKDNYFETTRYNIYWVRHNFSEIPCFFSRWYVITKVKEDRLEELKRLNEMNTVVLILIENNSKLWHLTNSENMRAKLHAMNNALRDKQKDIENEIKKCM